LCLVTAGCDIQRGHFVTTGDRSAALLSQVGLIEIVEGYSNDSDAVYQDLIYLLVVCPGVQTHGNGSGIDMGKYVTTLNYSWNAEPEGISIQLQWDREADIVYIGNRKFERARGDVFVVKRLSNGELECHQLPSLGKHADFLKVLTHIQQEMRGDELITSLQLYKN
jgi:hypothetical protein